MALGALSCASKVNLISFSSLSLVQLLSVQIILAQVDRDKAVLALINKMTQVYEFICQEETLDQISSMHIIIGQISQQTLECAHFIRDYSKTKDFCES
jgi:hypothetical protein